MLSEIFGILHQFVADRRSAITTVELPMMSMSDGWDAAIMVAYH